MSEVCVEVAEACNNFLSFEHLHVIGGDRARDDRTSHTMAATSLKDVLSSFTTATESANSGLPDSTSLLPPENGITLLDAKNELFLSYLQNLALRNLNVLRSLRSGVDASHAQTLNDKLTRKLVEHRVYLERGVRPLEQRIKYQVDKAVKAADDEERAATQKTQPKPVTNGRAKSGESDSDEDSDEEDEEEGGDEIDALAYRPNPSAFAAPAAAAADDNAARKAKSREDGVYRPPRVSATAMPTTDTRQKRERPGRSATLDEYVSSELASAPLAQPSIGSNVTAGGRRTKNAKDLEKERERREYEETNLVRLPKESKKELAKQKAREGNQYGGEEWRGLGESLDRIGDLTRRKGGKEGALDKSRKRGRDTQDSVRGDGTNGMGSAFDVKKRRMEKKGRR